MGEGGGGGGEGRIIYTRKMVEKMSVLSGSLEGFTQMRE